MLILQKMHTLQTSTLSDKLNHSTLTLWPVNVFFQMHGSSYILHSDVTHLKSA
jgi:hypothetical protein